MHTTPKITPADYPELLAAVAAGTTQRELARRYGCAPSLVARHLARARRARAPSEARQEPDLDLAAAAHRGSLRELLEARIRDPNTSARDLAPLINSLAKLNKEQEAGSNILSHRVGTLILEPEQRRPGSWRIMLRVPGGVEQVGDGLHPEQASLLAGGWLAEASRRALDLASPPDGAQAEPDASTRNGAHPEPARA